MKNWAKALTVTAAIGAFASAARIVEAPNALAIVFFLVCVCWLDVFALAQNVR